MQGMKMMPLEDWADFAAIISAMCDVVNLRRGTFENFFDRRISAPMQKREGRRFNKHWNTPIALRE